MTVYSVGASAAGNNWPRAECGAAPANANKANKVRQSRVGRRNFGALRVEPVRIGLQLDMDAGLNRAG